MSLASGALVASDVASPPTLASRAFFASRRREASLSRAFRLTTSPSGKSESNVDASNVA